MKIVMILRYTIAVIIATTLSVCVATPLIVLSASMKIIIERKHIMKIIVSMWTNISQFQTSVETGIMKHFEEYDRVYF